MEEKKNLLVKNSTLYKIVIGEELEKKIRHLCAMLPSVEWSGVLFYKTNGTFENKDLCVECMDLFVMDVGNATYTEFNDSPDILTYRVAHNLMEEGIAEGLIHSHNNMATFLSSTDLNTLKEKGNYYNHFVSLIVNNEGTYTAAITRRITNDIHSKTIKEITETVSYKTFLDEEVILKDKERRLESEETDTTESFVEYFHLEIEKPDIQDTIYELNERISEIRGTKNSVKPYNYYYPSLFDQHSYFSEVSSGKSFYKQSTVKQLAGYIITGSIGVDISKLNLEEWIKRMDKVYEKKFFPSKGENIDSYTEEWYMMVVEYVLNYAYILTGDKALDTKENYVPQLAEEITGYIQSLPQSKTRNIILLILSEYGTQDYRGIDEPFTGKSGSIYSGNYE